MIDLALKQNERIEINSDNNANLSYCFDVKEKSTLIIDIKGNNKLTIDIICHVEAPFTMLVLNNNNSLTIINDKYEMNNDMIVGYSMLNEKEVNISSTYNLNKPLVDLKVLTASLASEKMSFTQQANHLADHTSASIDNYGVVLKNGFTELIVKNKISKGYHNCETHQTNRLLTYDKTSKGKILPILYIDDNEVVASHACSLGQPDPEQVYYLQSRGLNYQQALNLITIGYLMPISMIVSDEKINEILKEEITQKVKIYV